MAEARLDARFYANVPEEQQAALSAFRAAHSYQHLSSVGLRWEYITCGQGRSPLLLLPGGMRVAEAAYTIVSALEPDCRLIVPSYPPALTLTPLLMGLIAILDAEGVGKTAVFGASYGGLVAQFLARRYPERVSRLALANTGVPATPEQCRAIPTVLGLLRVLPAALARALLLRNFGKLIPPGPEGEMARAHLREIMATRIGKPDLVSHFAVVLDASGKARFAPGDPAVWHGPTLILEAEGDVVTPERQAALRALYPQAQVHHFAAGGHTPWLTAPDEYLGVLRAFVRG